MRSLVDVIRAIKNQIPEDFKSKTELIAKLDDIAESASFSAPEQTYLWWRETDNALQDYLGDFNSPWKSTICEIMANNLDYRDYLN